MLGHDAACTASLLQAIGHPDVLRGSPDILKRSQEMSKIIN